MASETKNTNEALAECAATLQMFADALGAGWMDGTTLVLGGGPGGEDITFRKLAADRAKMARDALALSEKRSTISDTSEARAISDPRDQ